jgi:NAD(P)-dependent dehydrogenase (short-subunit alcohol dehydrogenase family)
MGDDAVTNQQAKTIFITGASSGLGRAAARLFASRGWTVIATMRTPAKEQELARVGNVVLLPLDITDAEQVLRTAAEAIALGDVDVVFNNAGYGMAGPLEGVTDDQMLRMVNTNLMGPIRVTKAFTPHFRAKRAGLFINTTSIGGLITVPFNSMYHATKWALEGWSEGMAFELGQFGIGMKIIEPGGMKTDFFTRSFDVARHAEYDVLVDRVMSAITDPNRMQNYSTPEQVADVVYEAATDGKDQLRYIAGGDAVATYAMRLQMGDEAFHKAIALQFFGSPAQA